MALALRQSAVCEQIMTVRRDSAPIIGRPIPYIWAEPDAPRRRQRRGLWRSRSPPGRQDEQALLAVEEDGGRRLADRGPSVSTTDAPSTAGARETGAYRGEDQQHLLNGRERRLRPAGHPRGPKDSPDVQHLRATPPAHAPGAARWSDYADPSTGGGTTRTGRPRRGRHLRGLRLARATRAGQGGGLPPPAAGARPEAGPVAREQ